LADHPQATLLNHPSIDLLMLLALNLIIVWYLYTNRNRLFRHRR
jgi:uncharacterized membrane protein (DUF2068 family)